MNDENGEPKRLDEPDQTNAQLIALVQNSWDLIEFAKTQQWRVTNYALLLFAAIVWVNRETGFGGDYRQKIILAAVAISGAAFAIATIHDSHKAQLKAWDRTKTCATHMSAKFEEIWKKDNLNNRAAIRGSYAWFLYGITAAGAAFAIWDVVWGA